MNNYHEITKARRNLWASCLRAFVLKFAQAMQICRAILCEIFDEAAFERFLVREQRVRSRESYRAFLAEAQCLRERRPRCC